MWNLKNNRNRFIDTENTLVAARWEGDEMGGGVGKVIEKYTQTVTEQPGGWEAWHGEWSPSCGRDRARCPVGTRLMRGTSSDMR